MASNEKNYPPGQHPDLPAPANLVGPIAWVRGNLLSSPTNIIMTVLAVWFLYTILPSLVNWLFLDAVYTGEDRNACRAAGEGACWAFIGERLALFTYGFYPLEQRWRVNLSLCCCAWRWCRYCSTRFPTAKYGLYYAVAFPFIAGWLLVGGNILGLELPVVSTDQFGGIMLTLVIGVTGIAFSLPIGILLALGRSSKLPLIRVFCIGFIEFIRGVPLITLLFVASTMLSYFLPPGTKFDLLLRVLIMVTLFASAYMAEVIRGGLQAIPNGQIEAGDALGLKYWPAMRLIVLPQALKISIPGIVNTFIGLYKDTTLVIIIGLLDPLGIGRASLADTKWTGLPMKCIFSSLYFSLSRASRCPAIRSISKENSKPDTNDNAKK